MFRLNKIIPTNSSYQFMSIRKMMLYISSFLVIISLFLLIFKGLNLGIDFKGGTEIIVNIKKNVDNNITNQIEKSFNLQKRN